MGAALGAGAGLGLQRVARRVLVEADLPGRAGQPRAGDWDLRAADHGREAGPGPPPGQRPAGAAQRPPLHFTLIVGPLPDSPGLPGVCSNSENVGWLGTGFRGGDPRGRTRLDPRVQLDREITKRSIFFQPSAPNPVDGLSFLPSHLNGWMAPRWASSGGKKGSSQPAAFFQTTTFLHPCQKKDPKSAKRNQ